MGNRKPALTWNCHRFDMNASGVPEGDAEVRASMRLCTFVCICGNSFILSEDYAKHLTTRHTCLECSERHGYKDVWGLRRHLAKIGRPSVACHCGGGFEAYPEMRQHEQTGHDCPECKKPAGSVGALRSHIYRSHLALSEACPYCSLRYVGQRGLTRHISHKHQSEGEAGLTAGNVKPTANPGEDEFDYLVVLTDRDCDKEMRGEPVTVEPLQGVDQGVSSRQGTHFGKEGVKRASKRKQANPEGQLSPEPLGKVARASRVSQMPPGISIQSHEKVRSWLLTDLTQNVSLLGHARTALSKAGQDTETHPHRVLRLTLHTCLFTTYQENKAH